MNRTPIWITVIVVAGVLALAILFIDTIDRRDYVPEMDNPALLRVYDVPAERAQDIRAALSAALSTGNETTPSLGRVTLSGTNQVVVLAPMATQATIAAAVEKLGGGAPAPATAGGSVRLSTWLVDALPGAGDDDPATRPIADGLAATRDVLGVVHFRVHDAVALTGLPNGGRMQAFSGRRTTVEAHLRPIAGGVQAELNIGTDQPGRLETTAGLSFGQTLVLAELAGPDGADGAARFRRLFVVRAEPVANGG